MQTTPSPVTENYFDRYTNLVNEKKISDAFEKQDAALNDFLDKITEDKSAFAYAESKWTLKEMLQHLIDAERVFCYRAMCIARGEKQNLPGFNENEYAAASDANTRSWLSLAEEMHAVRIVSKLLFDSFTGEMMDAKGVSNNKEAVAGKLGFIIIGHMYHHVKVAKEKYLG